MLLSNWIMMQMAHARDSLVLLSALKLLTNFVYANENAKASCVASSSTSIRRVENIQAKAPHTLLLVVTQTVIQRSVNLETSRVLQSHIVDIPLHNACCALLSSLVINTECLQWMIRFGLIAPLVNVAREQLKRTSQTTKKSDPRDSRTLSNILWVLTSVACTEDGRQTIASTAKYELRDIFDDILQSADEEVLQIGSRLLRNLAFIKNQFSVWESCMNSLVTCLEHRADRSDDLVARHLSCTLWTLVCDNQKTKSLLLARPYTLQRLEAVFSIGKNHCFQVRDDWPTDDLIADMKATRSQRNDADEMEENLKRVLLAMQSQ